jgi:2-haloacid dehalogenase
VHCLKEVVVASVIAFDVNETLLDLHALDEPFQTLLDSASLRPQWFC